VSSSPARHAQFDLAVGVVLPLAVVGAAYGLIMLENRLVYIGPWDRAVWGWLTIPLVFLAPAIAGLWWARLSHRDEWVARLAVGAVVGGVSTALLTAAVHQIGCNPATWQEVLPRMAVVGIVFAGGLVLATALAASAVRAFETWQARVIALIGSTVVGGATFFGALIVWATVTVVGVSCGGPPVPA